MKKTRVDIYFNGASNFYLFPTDKDAFMKAWSNQLPAIGYFYGYDENETFVVINPSHCGAIEIREVTA